RGCRFVPARARRAERARRRSARPLAPARDALPGHGLRRARDRRDRCAKRLRARRSRFGVLGAEERRRAFARGVHAEAEDPPAREPVALVLADRRSADARSGLEPALRSRPTASDSRLPGPLRRCRGRTGALSCAKPALSLSPTAVRPRS